MLAKQKSRPTATFTNVRQDKVCPWTSQARSTSHEFQVRLGHTRIKNTRAKLGQLYICLRRSSKGSTTHHKSRPTSTPLQTRFGHTKMVRPSHQPPHNSSQTITIKAIQHNLAQPDFGFPGAYTRNFASTKRIIRENNHTSFPTLFPRPKFRDLPRARPKSKILLVHACCPAPPPSSPSLFSTVLFLIFNHLQPYSFFLPRFSLLSP